MHFTAKSRIFLISAFGLLTALPILFLSFDPHHDGLILSTIRLTRESISHGSPLPFNQYGPGWSLFGTLITFFVPADYLMISLRILTLGLYIFTAILLYRFASRFLSERIAVIALGIYVLSHPFYSIYKSGFMAWPSAYVSPILLLLLFALNSDRTERSISTIFLNSSWIIFLVVFLIFTRLQVGIFTLTFIVAFFCLYRTKFERLFLISVLLCFALILLFVFSTLNLFKFAFLDEFEYGVFHAASDMGLVTPYLSLLGATFFAIIFLSLDRPAFSHKTKKYMAIILTPSLICLMLSIYVIALNRNLDLFALSSTIQRRFWVALFISAAGITTYKIIKALIEWRIKDKRIESLHFTLMFFAIIGFTQSYPLFDQMHVWWGSVPLILLISISFDRILKSVFSVSSKLPVIITFSIIFLNSSLLYQSLIQESVSFESRGLNLLRDKPSVVNNYDRLNNYFMRLIPEKSMVQNICPDANIFISEKVFRSSNHLSVFWPNFINTNYMTKSLRAIPDSYILDCTGAVKNSPNLFGLSVARLVQISEIEDVNRRMWSLYFFH
jgi:hypothetical protein